MTALVINKPTLLDTIEQAAQSQNLSTDEILDKAVWEYLDRWASQKIRSEQDAFAKLHTNLVTTYFGEYVAIHDGALVDHDQDHRTLHLRIRQKFGRMPILLRQVTEDINPPTLFWRSPRLEPVYK